jgi:chromosome partitioning protein
MGFLSRKQKTASLAVEEPHPIVEELQRMEEAVPERPAGASELHPKSPEPGESRPVAEDTSPAADVPDSEDSAPATAGPVAEDAPLPAGPVAGTDSSSSQAAGDEPAPTPPAGEGATETNEQAVPAVEMGSTRAPDDGRMKASDLIAPSRHDAVVEQGAEPEAPAKHAEVIAFANQKGGVAKTTTTLNLAVAFAESGHRVLCIDLDPQGNLTMSQGIDPDKVEKSLYDVLVNDMPISEIIQRREIDIAVASIDLAGAEIAMSTKIGRERSLEKALKEVAGDYDFVCIDTPPSLGLLTINALTAATKVIVPVQCEYLSMRGLVQLQNTLKMIQENLNPEVRIEGILPTMLDSRTVHAKEAVEILEENFGELVFKSRIKKAIKFAEAPVKGASVLKYDSGSSAANYYRELAKEVLANGSS